MLEEHKAGFQFLIRVMALQNSKVSIVLIYFFWGFFVCLFNFRNNKKSVKKKGIPMPDKNEEELGRVIADHTCWRNWDAG